MNNEKIIENMIKFIEEKEKDFQSSTLISDSQIKNDVVKAILDELVRVTENDN